MSQIFRNVRAHCIEIVSFFFRCEGGTQNTAIHSVHRGVFLYIHTFTVELSEGDISQQLMQDKYIKTTRCVQPGGTVNIYTYCTDYVHLSLVHSLLVRMQTVHVY